MNLFEIDGPVVSLVLLQPNGTIEEHIVDMTPRYNIIETLINGQLTINGQYIDEQVIIIKRRDETGLPWNKHVLPPPFHNDRIRGPICLVRMDDDAVPKLFKQKEYETLRNKYFITRNNFYHV